LKAHFSNVKFGGSEIYQMSSYPHPSSVATTDFMDRNYALEGGYEVFEVA